MKPTERDTATIKPFYSESEKFNPRAFIDALKALEIDLRLEGEKLRVKGKQSNLNESVVAKLKANKDSLVAYLRDNANDRNDLSYSQRSLYTLFQLQPASVAYNVACALDIDDIDCAALNHAFNALRQRHPMLRSQIVEQAYEVSYRVDSNFNRAVQELNLVGVSEAQLNDEIHSLIDEPFDLLRDDLCKLILVRVDQRPTTIVFVAHHIVVDFWSLEIALSELTELYHAVVEKRGTQLKNTVGLYSDFIAAEKTYLSSDQAKVDSDFWKNKLAGELPKFSISPSVTKSDDLPIYGASYKQLWTQAEFDMVSEQANEIGVSEFTFLLGVYLVFLKKISANQDQVVGIPTFGRSDVSFYETIGHFINTLPLRFEFDDRDSFATSLLALQGEMSELLEHQGFPFPLIVQEVSPDRDSEATPIYQCLFNWNKRQRDNTFSSKGSLGRFRFATGNGIKGASHPLTLSVAQLEHGCQFVWNYSLEYFDSEQIENLANSYHLLIKQALENSAVPVSKMVAVAQLKQPLPDPPFNLSLDSRLDLLVSDTASRKPDAIAVIDGETDVSYRQLVATAKVIAEQLMARGVKAGDYVAIYVERSHYMIASLIAVHSLDAAYLPLDKNYPDERVEYVLDDLAPKLVICDRLVNKSWELKVPTVELKDLLVATDEKQPPSFSSDQIGRCNGGLASFTYTSGSTGRPKAVGLTHRNIIARLDWASVNLINGELQGMFAGSSITFDLSIFEIFAPLVFGGSVILGQDGLSLADVPKREQVTLIHSVPSIIDTLMAQNAIPMSVTTIITAGERLYRPLADSLYSLGHIEKIYNLYGLSEDTIHSTCKIVDQHGDANPSIGRPLKHSNIHVLDANLHQLPEGVVGEVYASGEGLSIGYINQPALTAERFLPNPFAQVPGDRLYKSGDLARTVKSGELDIVGRSDHQVKLRGFRIELGEIEVSLMKLDGISGAVVIMVGEDYRSHRLMAFITQDIKEAKSSKLDDSAQLSANVINQELQKTLPQYMLPDRYIYQETLPRSANGKLDRKALTDLYLREHALEDGKVQKRGHGELHDMLAIAWQNALNINQVFMDSHFFNLGGHSLLAAQLIARVNQVLNLQLPRNVLFETPIFEQFLDQVSLFQQGDQVGQTEIDWDTINLTPNNIVSPAQRRMWLLNDLSSTDQAAYNVGTAIKLGGKVDYDAMLKAINNVVEAHSSFHCGFELLAGEIGLKEVAEIELVLETESISGSVSATENQWIESAEQFIAEPFDLSQPPLLRAKLISLTAEAMNSTPQSVLLLVMHHIISDGGSMVLLAKDVMRAYDRGELTPPDSKSLSYDYFAAWQNQNLGSQKNCDDVSYWRDSLAGVDHVLNLPIEKNRPDHISQRGTQLDFSLPAYASDKVIRLCRKFDVTLNMLGFATYALLLSRYTNQQEFVIGTPYSQRHQSEFDQVIGLFTNTLPIAIRIEPNIRFSDFLKTVRTTMLNAYQHGDIPFDVLVDDIGVKRIKGISPLVQASFACEHIHSTHIDSERLECELIDYPHCSAKFDWSLQLLESGGEISGNFVYANELFSAERMAVLINNWLQLLESIVESPYDRLASLSMSPKVLEPTVLVADSMNGDRDLGLCVDERVNEIALQYPGKLAVEFGDDVVSYSELIERSNKMEHALRSLGCRHGDRVGLLLTMQPSSLVLQIAIWRLGCAYVPIDPSYPQERIGYICRDAELRLIVVGVAQELIDCPVSQVSVSELESHPASLLIEGRNEFKSEADTAYIIYTSGSTGHPKGVAVSHRALNSLVDWHNHEYSVDSKIRASQLAGAGFDACVWETWPYLVIGAELVIAPNRVRRDPQLLSQWLPDARINICFMSTPLLQAVMDLGERSQLGVEYLLTGGDKLVLKKDVDLGFKLINHYGPTEFAVVATSHAVDTSMMLPPIGHVIGDNHLHVLDEFGHQVPEGVVGEAYLSGANLSEGYFNRAALTAAHFLPNPFSKTLGSRMYRTGDLMRVNADKQLCFIGRTDYQVKLRGFRIELGEIQNTIAEIEIVKEVVVALKEQPNDSVDAIIVAYIKPKGGVSFSDVTDAVIRAVKSKLPDHMHPSSFAEIESIPFTANGKVDYNALSAIEKMFDYGKVEYAKPRSTQEEFLVKIWEGLLKQSPIGIFDNFFEVGGHSMLAVQLTANVQRQLDTKCTVEMLFDNPTVAALASVLEQAGHDEAIEPLPTVQSDPDARYEPFPLSDIQQTYLIGRAGIYDLGDIATHVYVETDVTNLDVSAYVDAWRSLIERHDMLRMVITDENQQTILRSVPAYQIDLVDLSNDDHAAERLEQIAHEMLSTTRNGKIWPLFENRLSVMPDGRYRLHTVMDALMVDGWSNQILAKELMLFYIGAGKQLEPLTLSFRDYRLAEEKIKSSNRFALSRTYWLERLPNFPNAPELPILQGGEKAAQGRFKRRTLTLSKNQSLQLKQVAKSLNITPSTLLLTAYSKVLGNWSNSAKFVINLTLFNRLPIHPRVNDVVGDFTSLTLLEIDTSEVSFAQLANNIQRQLWRDIEHRHFSGVDVLREIARSSGGSQGTTMPIVFTSGLNGDDSDDQLIGMLNQDQLEFHNAESYGQSQTSQVWLDHAVSEHGGKLILTWDAIEDLFLPGTLDAMFAAYSDSLIAMLEESALVTSTKAFSLPADQSKQRQAYNQTQELLNVSLVHELVQQQVIKTPAAIAVIEGSLRLDYATLWASATQLALAVRAAGQRPNQLVAIVMHKGWEQVLASLAILQSGAAYLPIDANLPTQRVQQLLSQAEVNLAIVQAKSRHCVPAEANCQLIEINQQSLIKPTPKSLQDPSLASVQTLEDLAYVIFTSGSTGTPKGVMIEHGAVVNTLLDINKKFSLSADDRVLALSSLSFDLSVFDIFGVLISGGAIVLPQYDLQRDPSHWRSLIETHSVSVLNAVPALTQLMVDHIEVSERHLPDSLRLIMMSGDWIPIDLPDRIRQCSSTQVEPKIVSLGGATEASIWSIYYQIEAVSEQWSSIPYGIPLANQTFFVLADDFSDCPDWVTGELYIGGVGLARGYWRSKELTESRFIKHPLTGESLYRTGDLGRFTSDGHIEFLGREDSQVKVNGYRVELGDIEANLLQHPNVKNAVATVNNNAGNSLLAYVVLERPEHGAVVEDDIAKLELKGGGKALRDVSDLQASYRLDRPEFVYQTSPMNVEENDATVERFKPETPTSLTPSTVGNWLGCLATHSVENGVLPKRYYASAGSLYPVQVYVLIPPAGDYGIEAGIYYYHPEQHQLYRVLPIGSIPLATEFKSIELIFTAELYAIEPIYGDAALPFCELEAGYMSYLLADHGAHFGIQETGARKVVAPELAALLGLIQGSECLFSSTWALSQDVEAKTMLTMALPLLSRQSFRSFDGDTFNPSSLLALLKNVCREPCLLDGQFELLVYVKPESDDRPGKALKFEASTGKFVDIADVHLHANAHGEDNQSVFERSNCEIYLVGSDSTRDTLLNVGRLSQQIMTLAPTFLLGFCPVGYVNHEAIEALFSLSDDAFILHSLLGGSVSREQLRQLSLAQQANDKSEGSIEDIRSFLADRLPDYMQPDHVIELEAIPLSSNGKVARDRLPKPEQIDQSHTLYQAPTTPLEKQLVKSWQQMLGCERVGVHDDFFAIGGNSILLVRLHQHLQTVLSTEISIMDLFRFPSIASLAQCIESQSHNNQQVENEDHEKSADTAKNRAQQQSNAMRKFGRARQLEKGEDR